MNDFGFILTRHVKNETTNKYWNNSVKLLRTFYPFKKIVIIDDNSDKNFLKAEFNYKNVHVINSEFPGRGEILPYYYYIKNKFFENAIIIHDSIFFHKRVNFEQLVCKKINVLPLWFFYKDKENNTNTIRIASKLNNSRDIVTKLSDNFILGMKKWYGCFGVQSFINHSFLMYIQQKYTLTNLLSEIKCRADRCCLERIMGVIFYTEYEKIQNIKSLFGYIFSYQKWGYTYDEYMKYIINHKKIPKPVVKVWTGR
jgi:hypothetical protein